MYTVATHLAPCFPAARQRRVRVAVALLAVGLSVAACSGESLPGGGAGGTATALPSTDDVLGLPADAFDDVERSRFEALSLLDGALTVDDIDTLGSTAVETGELALTVEPGFIRVHYTNDGDESGELHVAEAAEWVVRTTDGASHRTLAYASVGAQDRQPLTQPASAEQLTADLLASWELSAGEAARIATMHTAGEIEQVTVPHGIDRPMTTVVVRAGGTRTRVTLDAVTGEALNAVEIL